MQGPLLAVGDKLEIRLDPHYGLGWVSINGFLYHLVHTPEDAHLVDPRWEVERVEWDHCMQENR